MSNGQFKPGDPRPEGAGRKPGVPNKITSTVKEAIEQAFSDLGGAEYLRRIAITEPKAFCALLGKLLPKNIELKGNLTLEQLVTASIQLVMEQKK